jgi:hypothetical protein
VRRRSVIVRLRVDWAATPLPAGAWILSHNSQALYRVIASEEAAVTCVRSTPSDVPPGARVHAWADVTRARSRPSPRAYRRADQLQLLLKRGAITERQFAAATRFRDTLERSTPQLPVAAMVHVGGVGTGSGPYDSHLAARRAVTRALNAIGTEHVPVLDWCVVGNGSIGGFASHNHTREGVASDRLRSALQRLEAHYNPPVTGRRR